ncbi:MAG: cation diffusion facilitator family transporter [Pseudolysinimonas sp.]
MAVVIAFLANIAIAIAKSVVALLTGSASILAEAIHSWADAGNEVFLLIADRKGERERDADHPTGYGRDAYVWSLFAAVGVFTVGAVLSIVTGVHELLEPEPVTDYTAAYIVLGIAFLLEGFSLAQSTRQAKKTAQRYQRNTLDYVINGSDPTLRAVIAEDTAALAGLAIAAASILLHQVTGNPVFDAVGSLLIGVLLGFVAVLLIGRNRRFLIGASPPPVVRARVIAALLAHHEIERVTYLHLEFIGVGRLFLVAAVDLTGNDREEQLAERLRRLDEELETDDVISRVVLTLSVKSAPSITQ